MAIEFRKSSKIVSARRNVAVFEYVDETGNLVKKAFISNSDDHAEMVGIKFLKENNIPHGSVKRIYTEREPCIKTATNEGNCAEEIYERFPKVNVEYSIDYGDTKELGKMAREELQKLIEQHVVKK